ncbi:DUF1573 domain-containing protein [Reichenbachiella versicolor]|uniref:DUF1573 domain-containing protein n=1 Tax=Reichenbachiella versicolor TaxID=1821036 RepID=UPI000D6E29DB|nr:DUF1573 domain-containing protein [Reichenbachiella versicolor]
MKANELLYISLFILISSTVFGQGKGQFEFEELEHNFGTFKEELGAVEYEFVFKNIGDAPIVITRVKASCGCTTPGWSNEPVLPGEKGFIKAKFNARNKPGSFRKRLTITSNAQKPSQYLYIKGNVIPKVKTVEERLSVKMGAIRLKSKNLNFSKITTEKPITKSFEIYNDSDSSITLLNKFDGPKFIRIDLDTTVLLPKKSTKLNVWYNPDHNDNLGMNNHSVSFYTSDSNVPKKISVIARIEEYFAPLSEKEEAKAPKLLIEDRLQDLGNIKAGAKVTAKYILRNGGVEKLNIRKIDTNCTCMTATLDTYDLKGGESTWLHVTFDSKGRRGRQTKSISVFSNDPKDPTQLVSMKISVTP